MPDAISATGAPTSTTLAEARNGTAAASGPLQEMNEEVFLKLLVTQLQNQDPSSPMDTNQMVSQAAQLSMTETLNKISTAMQSQGLAASMSTSAAMIGKEVDWVTTEGTGTGTVSGALFQNGKSLLELSDGTKVPLESVTSITE